MIANLSMKVVSFLNPKGGFYAEFATIDQKYVTLVPTSLNAQEAGGIYVFDNLDDANRYLEKHTQRLTSFGFKDIKSKIFVINEALSAITKASL